MLNLLERWVKGPRRRELTSFRNSNPHSCLLQQWWNANYLFNLMNGIRKLTTCLMRQQLYTPTILPLKDPLSLCHLLPVKTISLTSLSKFTAVTPLKSRSLKNLEIKSSLASGKPDQLEDVISTIKNLNRSKTTLPGHRTPSTPSSCKANIPLKWKSLSPDLRKHGRKKLVTT